MCFALLLRVDKSSSRHIDCQIPKENILKFQVIKTSGYIAYMKKFLGLLLIISFIGCKETYCPNAGFEAAQSTLLCTDCQSPNIHKVGTDKLIITYVQSDKEGKDALIMKTMEKGQLSSETTIASGDNWFVNWADIPSIVSLNKKGTDLMAHWLQMSAEGTYDYDVRCSISNDSGSTWNDSFILHDDKVSAEHGFVSMVTAPDGGFVTWLDGRNTKTPAPASEASEEHAHDDGHGHGNGGNLPMTLRAAWIDNNGNKSRDLEIDNKVCDCCQTDAVYTPTGPVVVYRDRSDDEIRDISIAKFAKDKWTHQTLFKDNWEIAGCPVNGPAIAYHDGLMAVAWYTQMNNIPKVYLALSYNLGVTFENPILVDEDGVLGRVDVAINEKHQVFVTWMESDGDETFVSCKIHSSHFIINDTQRLLVSNNQRAAGFPIIELFDNQLMIARTIIKDDELSVYLEVFDGP